jgi:glyoxylate utilization-related uncharacterized protein
MIQMHVVRFADAPAYASAGHDGMRMLRLQGREAGPTDTVWIGVSTLEPGGSTTLDASAVEKIYVVLDGQVTVSNGVDQHRLQKWDSCRVAPYEGRRLQNETQQPASILLVMPVEATTPP